MLVYKSSLNLTALAIITFGIYLAVGVELGLQISALISLSLSFGITISVFLSLQIALALIVQFNIALSLSLPELVLNLKLALEFELSIVLGLIATIDALIEAVASASLVAYAYVGTGAQMSGQVSTALAAGWPDGTPGGQNVTAYLFVATATGPYTTAQVASASLVPPPATPPTPPPPSPPAGSYPPPQAYEHGLASVSFPYQIYPTILYPADPATGVLTINNSVATGIGAITGISITHNGGGYPSPAMVMISDTVTLVSVTTGTPVVVTVPSALGVALDSGIGVTIADVTGTTSVLGATNASPIVITLASTTNLLTATIANETGNTGVNGQWYCKVLSPTTAALYYDPGYTMPSSGTGAYAGAGTLTGNVNGLQFAKVTSDVTLALYQDSAMTIPLPTYDASYTGGTLTGGGQGAVATASMGGGANTALKSFFSGLLWPHGVGPALVGGSTTFQLMLGTTSFLLLELLSNLKSRAAVLAAASASASIAVVPPTINASISLLGKIVATLKANLGAKIGVYAGAAISVQIAIVLSLWVQIAFMLGIGDVDLEIWEYTGSGNGFAPAIAAGPGTSGWHDGTSASSVVAAGVFGLTNSASAEAFAMMFGGA